MGNNLIGLCGYAGSGKSEFAMELWRLSGTFTIKSYSRKLKEVAGILTGLEPDDFEIQDVKAQRMPDMWTDILSGHTPTYREFLQKLGTDVMRDHLHKDIWVNALFSEWNQWGSEGRIPKWIIADVRFPNEAQAIRDRGGVLVRMERGKPVNNHISEIGLDDYYFDFIVDNTGDMDMLKKHAKHFYETVMI
jgi:hypothetical protein